MKAILARAAVVRAAEARAILARVAFVRAGLALAILLASGGGSALAAQEVAAWFDRSPDAAAYSSIRQELLSLAAESISAMHSDLPLAERLAEGARKHVPPDRLAGALESETLRLGTVAAEIDQRGLLPRDAKASGTMMAQLGIALRSGLDPQDIGAAFDGAVARLGQTAEARSRALAVISAVAGLSLDTDQRFALIGALAASPLPTTRFRGVRGSLADLMAQHLSPAAATAALIDSFGARPQDTRPSPMEQGSHKNEGKTSAEVPGAQAPNPSAPTSGPGTSGMPMPHPSGTGPALHPAGPGMPAPHPEGSGMEQNQSGSNEAHGLLRGDGREGKGHSQ